MAPTKCIELMGNTSRDPLKHIGVMTCKVDYAIMKNMNHLSILIKKYGFVVLSKMSLRHLSSKIVKYRVKLSRIVFLYLWDKPIIRFFNYILRLDVSRMLLTINTNQAWPARVQAQLELFSSFSSPISCLEIGVWFGKGSTSNLMKVLPTGSTLISVDRWEPYVSELDRKTSEMDNLTFLAAHSALNVFSTTNRSKFNRNIEALLVKADSVTLMKFLPEERFDLIYIDGSHYYPKVSQEIEQAKRIVKKNFAIISGDDLEVFPNEFNILEAAEHLDQDLYNGYHPGVLLAVGEAFVEVNMVNGFWWVYCKDGVFTARI